MAYLSGTASVTGHNAHRVAPSGGCNSHAWILIYDQPQYHHTLQRCSGLKQHLFQLSSQLLQVQTPPDREYECWFNCFENAPALAALQRFESSKRRQQQQQQQQPSSHGCTSMRRRPSSSSSKPTGSCCSQRNRLQAGALQAHCIHSCGLQDKFKAGSGTYVRGGFIYASVVGAQQTLNEGTDQASTERPF